MKFKIKKILCPLDLTSESIEVLSYAFPFAAAYDAKLFLCHYKEKPYAPDYPSQTRDSLKGILENTALKYQNGFESHQVDVEVNIIEGADDAADGIVKTAADLGIDLIVMRSRRVPSSLLTRSPR